MITNEKPEKLPETRQMKFSKAILRDSACTATYMNFLEVSIPHVFPEFSDS